MQFFPKNSPRIKNYFFIEIVSDFGLLYAKSLLKYYYSINTIFPFFKLYEALFFHSGANRRFSCFCIQAL